jgi:hypothetical protein
MINKQSYSVQMNYTVPDSEKRIAKGAAKKFEYLITKMDRLVDYLDILYTPLKEVSSTLDMNLVEHNRLTFRKYRDVVEGKFDQLQKIADDGAKIMEEFSADTATEEMMVPFSKTIKELQKYKDMFVSIFSNLNDQEFKDNVIAIIDSTRKQINQIKQLVNDRILEHIYNNILAHNWSDNMKADDESEEYKSNEHVPLVVQLFNERRKALSNV